MDLDLIPTVAIMILALAFSAFCGWRGARPWDIRKGPRMMPWRFLMMVGVVVVILMLVHLLNISGVQTGRNQGTYAPLH